MLIGLAIGLMVGLVLGLTGAGGSLVAVPLLMLGLALAPAQAMGLALAVVAVSAAWGLIGRIRSGQVVWLPALVVAAAGVMLAPVGRWLAHQVSETWLTGGFALLVLIVAARMWQQSSRTPEAVRVTRAEAGRAALSDQERAMCRFSASGKLELRPRCLSAMLLGGVATGLLSGLFGVGGGFVIVPMLTLITGLSMPAAVATSLAVIAPVSLAGFGSYVLTGASLPMGLLAALALGGISGMLLGSRLSARLAGPRLQKIFVGVMLVLMLVVLIR